MSGWVCLTCKVTLEVSWFDLLNLTKLDGWNSFLKLLLLGLQWFGIMLKTGPLFICHMWYALRNKIPVYGVATWQSS